MSRPKHRISVAGAYFVTSKTWESRKLFHKDPWAKLLIEVLMNYQEKKCYALHDFVVMPDHFHLIVTPGGDYSLEKAVQMVKGGSSRMIGKTFETRFPIWQKGFHEHWIRSEKDYETRKKYLEQNPVKAGLVTRSSEYPYSSASGEFRVDPFTMTSAAKAAGEGAELTAGLKPRPAKTFRRPVSEIDL